MKILVRETFKLPGVIASLEVTVGAMSPKEIWETKNNWHEFVAKSKGFWDGMTEDQKESVENVVKDGLERLHDKVSEWVPEALEVMSGNYLDVHLRILFTDVDHEIQREATATSLRVKEALRGNIDLLADLGIDLNDDEDEAA